MIFWVYKKDRVNHVDRQGRDLLNAQISYSLYQIILFLAFMVLLLAPALSGNSGGVPKVQEVGFSISLAFALGFVPIGSLLLLAIVLPVVKAIKIFRGKEVKPYPLKIRFIR